MEVLGKDLVEGDFYHCYAIPLCGEAAFNDVWYSNGRSLINPRNKDHGHCTVGTYYPLTIEEVDAFTDWMTIYGDEAGIKVWNKYKEKLIKEAKMANNKKDVDLYDPKFVHFEWSEDLKGKKGFFASDIGTIKKELHYKGPCMMGTLLHYSDNEARPFVVKFQGGTGEWRFFYYDPNYEVKWAYFKEKKPIQIRRDSTDEWKDIYARGEMVTTRDCVVANIKGPEYFDDDFEYRIKPEEEADYCPLCYYHRSGKKGQTTPEISVDVDINVKKTSNVGSIKVQINGKEVVFENVDQARLVLGV